MDFFKRNFLAALIAVLGLIVVAYVGVKGNLQLLFGVVTPYMALLIFFEGIIYRVIKWARSPVPFRIPTTAAQHESLPWLKRTVGEKLDNPSTFPYTVGRMALEILAFRTLFRNTRSELIEAPNRPEGAKLVHWSYKWLWIGALAFHYAFSLVDGRGRPGGLTVRARAGVPGVSGARHAWGGEDSGRAGFDPGLVVDL